MALNKQIQTVRFESTFFTSGNNNAGQQYAISVQDYSISIDPEFYTGNAFDKAISGRLRQNLRGLRPSIELRYNQSLQENRMRLLFNDLIAAFVTNNAQSVSFYPDGDKLDNFEVVFDSGSYASRYNSTIGVFEPTISLVSLDEIFIIPEYLEAP